MSTRTSTLVTLIVALAVACLWFYPLEAQERGREAKDNSAKIAAALQEMRTTSKQLVALRRQAYRAGQISLQEFMAAQRQFLEMELKLAKAPAERINVLSQQLQLAKDAEKVANAFHKKAEGNEGDVLEARIARLRIEVLILEELN
jgi:hypothetical protein